MSSLRISHQNRAIGATAAGGDTGRSEHADDRSSFAAALGAAGAAPKGGGDIARRPDGRGVARSSRIA